METDEAMNMIYKNSSSKLHINRIRYRDAIGEVSFTPKQAFSLHIYLVQDNNRTSRFRFMNDEVWKTSEEKNSTTILAQNCKDLHSHTNKHFHCIFAKYKTIIEPLGFGL